jgi:hypothetical protein
MHNAQWCYVDMDDGSWFVVRGLNFWRGAFVDGLFFLLLTP